MNRNQKRARLKLLRKRRKEAKLDRIERALSRPAPTNRVVPLCPSVY